MGALLKLIGRQPQVSQALVTAPSANLIMSDNEFVIPELEEITLNLGKHELDQQVRLGNSIGKCNPYILTEFLAHTLKSNGFKTYSTSKVDNFMKKQVAYCERMGIFKKFGSESKRLECRWVNFQELKNPIPPRISSAIETIHREVKYAYFQVSDITHCCSREQLDNKLKTEICFLQVIAYSHPGFIIDAWRGPTSSDEEARLSEHGKI